MIVAPLLVRAWPMNRGMPASLLLHRGAYIGGRAAHKPLAPCREACGKNERPPYNAACDGLSACETRQSERGRWVSQQLNPSCVRGRSRRLLSGRRQLGIVFLE